MDSTNANPSTRRQFLKTTAGGALAANLALLSNAHAEGNDTIKVGVIGCGGRGSQAAENVLSAAPNVEVVAIGDAFQIRVDRLRKHLAEFSANDETVRKLGNKANLPQDRCFAGLDAYKGVINAPGVNYIILATPPGFRPLHLQAAIAAGKNVFTEKPVAVDGPGCRKVLAAYDEAQKKNLGIAAGTQRRHQLGYLETMKRIHDGAIGDLTAALRYWNQGPIWFRRREELAKMGAPETDLAFHLHNWYHFVWVCGDHICEQHVHNLDVVNWATGKHPSRAVGMGGRVLPCSDPNADGHIFNFFAVDFEYPGGMHMLSMSRQVANCVSNVSEDLVGSKGTCHTDAGPQIYTINGKPVLTRKQVNDSSNPYVQEHTDLIESLRAGKPINELKNVAESTLTAIMGRMTCYTGKAVSWDQALNSKEDTFPGSLDWNMSLSVPPVAYPGKTPLV